MIVLGTAFRQEYLGRLSVSFTILPKRTENEVLIADDEIYYGRIYTKMVDWRDYGFDQVIRRKRRLHGRDISGIRAGASDNDIKMLGYQDLICRIH